MKFEQIRQILNAQVVCCEEHMATEASAAAYASDMMSDVLAYVKEQAVLLTGLVNPQVVRTAEMMDMKCIVFVRGKNPDLGMIELAEENGIPLLKTKREMFTSCGILYENGLRGGAHRPE